MTKEPELVPAAAAIHAFLQTTAITSNELRTLPAQITHELHLSRKQELKIREIVMDAIITISNSADYSISAFDLIAGTEPLGVFTIDEIARMPEWEFRLRAEASGEVIARELTDITHKVFSEPIDWAAVRAARERGH
jgi:hypothetical protein